MIRNAVIIGLGAVLLAACVPVPNTGPNPPSSPPPDAQADLTAKFEPGEGKPLAPVDVRKLTCATLTGSTDDDKAYATSFLLGYRSALMHSRTIEIKRIEAVEEAALADCVGKPDALATKIFAAALRRIGPGGELVPPPHVAHHRAPGQAAAPGEATPGQQPPAPSQEAPIQYTPTQATPLQPAPTLVAPTPAAPTQAMPAQATPIPTAPTVPAPAPAQAAPAPTEPAQAATPAAPPQAAPSPPPAPTQAAPPQPAPPQAAPPTQPPAEPAPPPAVPANPSPNGPEQKQ